jgi:ABC-type transport system substrate-binding protein
MGILPKHAWESISAEEFPFAPLNTHPIGTGPYKIRTIDTDETGAATRYELEPFEDFTLGAPHISRLHFLFFPNEGSLVEAYNSGKLDGIAGVTASELHLLTRPDQLLVRAPLPRVFGIYFNQNKNTALSDVGARAALDTAIDKQAIISHVLGAYGHVLESPIPPGIIGKPTTAVPSPFLPITLASTTPSTQRLEQAREILEENNWSRGTTSAAWSKKKLPPLSIKLATTDAPELVATADMVADTWRALGVEVSVITYPISEFNNTILRPREYDAVLFGQIIGRETDLFAFWHSTQRNDPGLNLALYTNAKADTLLTEARATTNRRERSKLYEEFETLVKKDVPAVFLYSPEFLYLVPPRVKGIEISSLTMPSERFLNVHRWYTDTEHVWSFFTDKQTTY